MNINDNLVVQILLKQNYITQKDIDDGKAVVGEKDLVEQFIKNGILTKKLIGQAIAEFFGFEYINMESKDTINVNLEKIPTEISERYSVLYLEETEKVVSIVTSKPENIKEMLPEIAKIFVEKRFKVYFILEEDFKRLVGKFKKPLQERFEHITKDPDFAAPNLFQEILDESFNLRATDIHFEPQRNNIVLLRFRIDGLLRDVATFPIDIYEKIINRVKVLAHLRIDEHFTPQDGSIRLETPEYSMDLRISLVPTLEGEKIAIRILSDYIKNLSFAELGLDEKAQKILSDAIKKRHGMILNTGPTGCGKTTTLYAVLRLLQNQTVNVTTIEDPVEYRMPGVNQIQVDQEHGITFARGLRSIVRQDPNIILVGEIRDNETAEIAVNASLTGHLLLSTFHANDAATAIPRLIDMGIEPFLLASTLSLIIAQRLVRRICLNCRTSHELSHSDLSELIPYPKEYFPDKVTRMYYGKGCEKCNFTGFQGRIAIFEMITVTSEIKDLIETSPSTKKVWDTARKQGAQSFFEDGIQKVKLGFTTLEELLRVAPVTPVEK